MTTSSGIRRTTSPNGHYPIIRTERGGHYVVRDCALEQGPRDLPRYSPFLPLDYDVTVQLAATPDPDGPDCLVCGGGRAHFPECSALGS